MSFLDFEQRLPLCSDYRLAMVYQMIYRAELSIRQGIRACRYVRTTNKTAHGEAYQATNCLNARNNAH
jgi:hypothetical protein